MPDRLPDQNPSSRQEAFALLDKLCRDCLEVPLASVLQYPGGETGEMFARLFDLIEKAEWP